VKKAVQQQEEIKQVDWTLDAANAIKAQLDQQLANEFPGTDLSKHSVRLNMKFKCFASNAMLVLKPNQDLSGNFEKILHRKCSVSNNFINIALTLDEEEKLQALGQA
jgi:hypothetical protein